MLTDGARLWANIITRKVILENVYTIAVAQQKRMRWHLPQHTELSELRKCSTKAICNFYDTVWNCDSLAHWCAATSTTTLHLLQCHFATRCTRPNKFYFIFRWYDRLRLVTHISYSNILFENISWYLIPYTRYTQAQGYASHIHIFMYVCVCCAALLQEW